MTPYVLTLSAEQNVFEIWLEAELVVGFECNFVYHNFNKPCSGGRGSGLVGYVINVVIFHNI